MTVELGEHWRTGDRVLPIVLDELWTAARDACAFPLIVCEVCGASWHGALTDSCWWCERALEAAQDRARDDTLRPPDVGHDHELREAAFAHWGNELRHAVDTGSVSRAEAEAAWRRAAR
jgi:hypothetical protein